MTEFVYEEVKILVCGGRDFDDYTMMDLWLTKLQNHIMMNMTNKPKWVLIHGGARGADTLAHRWAQANKIEDINVFKADWNTHGKAAGALRNEEMLNEDPDYVIGFEGGNGTRHMCAISITRSCFQPNSPLPKGVYHMPADKRLRKVIDHRNDQLMYE